MTSPSERKRCLFWRIALGFVTTRSMVTGILYCYTVGKIVRGWVLVEWRVVASTVLRMEAE